MSFPCTHHPTHAALTSGIAAGVAVLTVLTAAPPGEAKTTPGVSRAHSRHVAVAMSAAVFRLPARTKAGWVTFTARTSDPAGHQLEGFRTKHGATASDVVDDITRAVSFDQATSVKGTADTRRDAVLVGGPSVDPTTPVSVTVALRRGTYYFFDFDDFFIPGKHVTVHRMEVVGRFHGRAPRAHGRIIETMVGGHPRFRGPRELPARSTIAVHNEGDELHEVLVGRVRAGTTDAQVQSYYASGSTQPPSYGLEAPLRGVAAMDPGRVAYVRFPRLPVGRYALLCFVPDDETGLPHVAEGMHAVVRMHR